MRDDTKNGCVGDYHEGDEAHCVLVSWALQKIDVANYVNIRIGLFSFVWSILTKYQEGLGISNANSSKRSFLKSKRVV